MKKNKILSTLAVILTATVLGACGKTSSTGSGPSQIPTGPGPGGSISDYTAYCAYIGGVVQWNGTSQYCRVQKNYVNGSYTWALQSTNPNDYPQIIASNPPTRIGPLFPAYSGIPVVAQDRIVFEGKMIWDLGSTCNYDNHSSPDNSPMLASDGTVIYNLGSNNVETETTVTTSSTLYLGFEQLPSSNLRCAKMSISKLIVHHCEDSNRQTISCP